MQQYRKWTLTKCQSLRYRNDWGSLVGLEPWCECWVQVWIRSGSVISSLFWSEYCFWLQSATYCIMSYREKDGFTCKIWYDLMMNNYKFAFKIVIKEKKRKGTWTVEVEQREEKKERLGLEFWTQSVRDCHVSVRPVRRTGRLGFMYLSMNWS